jgi:alkylglycerol monooxygenase
LILSALFILICVINTGAILEKRSWVFHLEFARLAALSIFMYSITENAQIGLLLIAAFIILILFYQDAEERYLKLIYQH